MRLAHRRCGAVCAEVATLSTIINEIQRPQTISRRIGLAITARMALFDLLTNFLASPAIAAKSVISLSPRLHSTKTDYEDLIAAIFIRDGFAAHFDGLEF
jgi:hypothetical protein